jgi:hypothetical protein
MKATFGEIIPGTMMRFAVEYGNRLTQVLPFIRAYPCSSVANACVHPCSSVSVLFYPCPSVSRVYPCSSVANACVHPCSSVSLFFYPCSSV